MSTQQAAVLEDPLAQLKAAGLYRQNKTLSQRQGHQAMLDGRAVTLFCSNDYLGLSQHPEVVRALQQSADDWGVGSGAAHLISGHHGPHAELEEAFADFMGYEAALLFSTGYMANLGVISTFAGRHDVVLQDKLNHASLLDGAKLAGAKLSRYRHADMQHAATKLPAKLLASDGVFSMDGDIAPLAELAALAKQQQTPLLVDDAHGFGALGPQGRGSVAAAGLTAADVPLQLCTLGKAGGTFGAILLGSRSDIERCVNTARSYIYTTALPAAMASASLAALNVLRRADDLRQKLQANIGLFRQGSEQLGLPLLASSTAIQPLLVPGNQAVMAASQQLLEAGFLVTAIRSPTVAVGAERLRITLSVDHGEDDINRLLDALAEACK
jgi:8-amino-7-oxononanoate synthase